MTRCLILAVTLVAIGCKHQSATVEKKVVSNAAPTEIIVSGVVEPRNVVSVAPTVEGVLDAWTAETGESVYKEQLLARIRVPKLEDAAQQAQTDLDRLQSRFGNLDGAQVAAKLEISRAEAEKSRADAEADRLKKIYDRYKSLWDLGAIARLDFEKSEKDYKSAQAAAEDADKALKTAKGRADAAAAERGSLQKEIAEKTSALEQARAGLSSGDVHSPADGIVTARHGDAGQPVDPSMKDFVQIATDLTQLQIIVTPSPVDLARIRPGMTVAVQFELGDYSGTVREIRGEQVVIDFNTSAPIAKLGGAAQVKIKF